MRFGVDVGGTTVKLGVFEGKKLKDSFSITTTKETLFDDIRDAIKAYTDNVEFIGFGFPGHVVNNYIYNLPNIGITNFDLNEYMAKEFPGIRFASTNDANAAALGEQIADGKYASSYMITLGTGVGGGLIIDNKLINGSHGNCGEIGHMVMDKHNYQCSCGLKGCLETVASATGIVRLANHYKNDYKTNIDFENISAKAVFDAAKEGDELGSFVFDYVCDILARTISLLAVVVDVECIYIGGGVAAVGQILIDTIKEKYLTYCHYAVKNLEIKLASVGNKAGIIGAAFIE